MKFSLSSSLPRHLAMMAVAAVFLASSPARPQDATAVEPAPARQQPSDGSDAPVATQPVATQGAAAEQENAEVTDKDLGGGMASYYGSSLAGNRTASGERFDPSKLTAAHRTLPFGSMVRVTHARSGRSVVVRINDRGPFHGARVIDVSEAAARQLGLVGAGSGQVSLSLLP